MPRIRAGVNVGGRPPRPPELKQSERIMVTLTAYERAKLESVAGDAPLGTYIRDLVIRHLTRRKKGR